jgi:hypothetical protein
MGDTHDPLHLGVKKARGCTQLFRRFARGETNLAELDRALATSSGCQGRGCDQCAEAALRLVDFIAWKAGVATAREVAAWVERYVRHVHPDFRLRAETVGAALLRYSDPEAAVRKIAATAKFRDAASPSERAHHFALGAVIFTEAYLVAEGREAVIRSRELYRLGSPADPERGPAWAAIADVFVETCAPYTGLAPRFESIDRALKALISLDKEKAPRTCQALLVNVLTLIVSAWRSGFEGIEPHAVLRQIEASFDFQSRRSDPAATSMRWLWVVVASKIEGLSQTVRNRLRHARSGLIAQQRWQDLLYLELDVLWTACYFRRRPQRSRLLSQTKHLRRALSELDRDSSLLDAFERVTRSQNHIPGAMLKALFALRGLQDVQVDDVRVDEG